MKIIISLGSLLIFLTYYFLFQPLIKFKLENTSEFLSFVNAIIGASGSIIGGIIGGIITGFVALRVAKYELDKDAERLKIEKNHKLDNLKKLILEEISTNNLALAKLDEASDTHEIKTTLKYSLSDLIFSSCKTELEIDDFFVSVVKYYRILNRLITDDSIHNEEEFETIDEEIKALNSLERKLKLCISNPTTN